VPLITDLRQVVRRLTRAPMFTFVTLLTIAIGIGANSAIFSVINGVLFKPLPYPDASALIAVWQTAPKLNLKQLEVSPSDYFVFRQEIQTFKDFGV
jgi:ABC-type antimicrobial peptide transport system permease subunit